MALAALTSCAGELAACAGADCADAGCAGEAGCAGVGSAGVDVIACDDGIALDCEAAGATVVESAVDGVAAGVLAAARLLSMEAVEPRSLRAGAFAVVELEVRWEALAFEAGATSTSFIDLLDFARGVADGVDSTGAFGVLESLLAWATTVEELLAAAVSSTLGVAAKGARTVRDGCATTSCEATRWSNTKAPPITMATMAANAIPKCLTRFSCQDVISF